MLSNGGGSTVTDHAPRVREWSECISAWNPRVERMRSLEDIGPQAVRAGCLSSVRSPRRSATTRPRLHDCDHALGKLIGSHVRGGPAGSQG